MMKTQLLVVLIIAMFSAMVNAKKVHYIHWNRNNPMFRIDNTDHIVDVNKGNLPWEYDQVNLICPVSKPGAQDPESHVIYSVSREEFDSCRITNPKPKIVAICNRPHRLMYFTITFRSFTPTPGGLEFRPGQDYYFISTSTRDDLHRRVGGGCSTHNMKMIFKVHENIPATETSESAEEQLDMYGRPEMKLLPRPTTTTTASTTTARSVSGGFGSSGSRTKNRGEYIYYYHPRDLIELENTISNKKISRDYENEVWKNEALRYTSSSSSSTTSSSSSVLFSSHSYLLTLSLITLAAAAQILRW